VIKSADWIVDLGPEGGSGGGAIVAEGTPEQVAKVPESHTGRFLAPMLDLPKPAPKAATTAKTAKATKKPAKAAPRPPRAKAPARAGRR
jgi:excinuclease ABC subunit A